MLRVELSWLALSFSVPSMRPQPHTTNAIWNLLGGASMSVMVLLVPYWLNLAIGPEQYGLWALAYQVIAYIPLLGFGINLVLIRGVADSIVNADSLALRQILSNGFWILMGLIGIGLLVVGLSGIWIDRLLPISSGGRLEFQFLWWTLGAAGSSALLSLYFFGVFGGHQQYFWENAYKTILVFSFVLGLWLMSIPGHLNLLSMARLYSLAVGVALFFLVAIYFYYGFPKPKWDLVNRASAFHMVRAMGGLGVWNLSLVLVSGLDLWIVASIDFGSVPGYALALSLMTFIMGVGGAFFSPSLPIFAKALAQSDRSQFRHLFCRYQRWLIVITLTITAGIILLPNTLWIGLFKDSSRAFIAVMPILLIATALRLLTLLYAYALVGANRQHQIIVPPILEGVLNLALSIGLGVWLGPVGVALGTLGGALLCLAMATLYNIPRQRSWIPIYPSDLLFPWKKVK